MVALVEFRFETAKVHLEAAVKTYLRQLGFESLPYWALNLLQRVYFYLGDLKRAEGVCHEVIGEWQKRGVVYWEAMNFLYLGELALERGDFAEALEYAETSAWNDFWKHREKIIFIALMRLQQRLLRE